MTDQEETAPAVKYSASPGLLGFLDAHDLTICMSSYQSGRFYLIGRNPRGGLMINEEVFGKAMGIFVQDETIHLAAGTQIYRLENTLRPGERAEEVFDHCFVPRTIHTVGPIDTHDIAIDRNGEILFVSTAFNCVAKRSQKHSFEPIWKPPFVSRVVREDRCHLNGMALRDGRLAYVTAVSKSDTIDGWRDRRADGGVVIDTQTDQIICEGLSMPHSPRFHNGKLWLLNSGTGELGFVDRDKPAAEAFTPIVFCPGFARGLALQGKYAFVGLSRPRYERFEGLALDQKLRDADSEPWCGLQIIDLETGQVAAWLRVDGAVQELYDVALLPQVFCAMSLAPNAGQLGTLVTWDDTLS